MRRNASYNINSKPNKFAYAVVVYLIYRKKILNSSDNKNTNDMSNATNMGNYKRNTDTPCNDQDDSDSDFVYPNTQPRSLAALAERDRQRERAYQQQLAHKHTSGSNTVRSASQISSSAMIVGESVSQSVQQRKIAHTVDVVDSVNVNGCHIIALNSKKSDENNCVAGGIGGDNSDFSEKHKTTSTATNNMNKNKGVANVLGPREYVLTPMVDKKTRSGGFLSRFAGFRFSLRGNKKKQKNVENNEPQVSDDNVVMVTKSSAPGATSPPPRPLTTARGRNETGGNGSGAYQRNSMRSNEFVYIPLRDPIIDKTQTSITNSSNNNLKITNVTNTNQMNSVAPITSMPTQSSQSKNSISTSVERKHVLTAKPPLPRLPPRVVGVCAKQQPGSSPSSPAATTAGVARTVTIPVNGRDGKGILTTFAQGPAQRANSAPREINASDMRHYRMATADDNDDDFYQQFRLDRRMKQSGGGVGGYANYASGPSDGAILRADPNDTSFTDNEGNLTIAGDGDYKIGLIETNLDTHETVISGKTRSLMELGPQQMSLHGRGAQSAATRRTVGATPNKVGSIVEPRRPHKSMEFLLDKENQKLVLVSFVLCKTNLQTYTLIIFEYFDFHFTESYEYSGAHNYIHNNEI